jgi:hypothetical protein
MANNAHLKAGRSRMEAVLQAAGWPAAIGLNDKRFTSHNRLTLDGWSVHTCYTKGHGVFVYDPALERVARAETLDAALLRMVARRDFGRTGVGRNDPAATSA